MTAISRFGFLTVAFNVVVPKLKIANLPTTTGTYMLVVNSSGNVFKNTIPTGGGATINNGINTFTAGTSTFQSVNVTALTIDNLIVSGNSVFSGTLSGGSSFSANTLFSGSTNLNSIFATPGLILASQTFVQPGINTYTGGTNTHPSVNVSALTIDNITVSGNSSFNTLSATTIYSGSTLLSTIMFQQTLRMIALGI